MRGSWEQPIAGKNCKQQNPWKKRIVHIYLDFSFKGSPSPHNSQIINVKQKATVLWGWGITGWCLGLLGYLKIEGRNPRKDKSHREGALKSEYKLLSNPWFTPSLHMWSPAGKKERERGWGEGEGKGKGRRGKKRRKRKRRQLESLRNWAEILADPQGWEAEFGV